MKATEHTHFQQTQRKPGIRAIAGTICGAAAVAAVLLILSACGPKREKHADTAADSAAAQEEFHADNDIAMTVRSIADAIRVGEPLDSAGYSFSGILTDGQGRPLYTDTRGCPGEWSVEVVSDGHALIRNLSLGDLLADDLKNYVTQSLNLSGGDAVKSEDPGRGAEVSEYEFEGGLLRIETRKDTAPGGFEGSMVSITLKKRS